MGEHASGEISRETDEVDLGDRKRWGEAPVGILTGAASAMNFGAKDLAQDVWDAFGLS